VLSGGVACSLSLATHETGEEDALKNEFFILRRDGALAIRT
jgi:hypothetical protein